MTNYFLYRHCLLECVLGLAKTLTTSILALTLPFSRVELRPDLSPAAVDAPMETPDAVQKSSATTETHAGCHHTLHLTDQSGQRHGTWINERVGNRVRAICRLCGRFYGYLQQ